MPIWSLFDQPTIHRPDPPFGWIATTAAAHMRESFALASMNATAAAAIVRPGIA